MNEGLRLKCAGSGQEPERGIVDIIMTGYRLCHVCQEAAPMARSGRFIIHYTNGAAPFRPCKQCGADTQRSNSICESCMPPGQYYKLVFDEYQQRGTLRGAALALGLSKERVRSIIAKYSSRHNQKG